MDCFKKLIMERLDVYEVLAGSFIGENTPPSNILKEFAKFDDLTKEINKVQAELQ